MTTFITSDIHFNHEAIIRFCLRPWPNVWDMNEALIENWNDVVGPTDTVYVLGDFGFDNKRAHTLDEVFRRLNGHKHLVVGNHDEKNKATMRLAWESVTWYGKYRNTTPQGAKQRAILSHYPFETWDGAGRGTIMLHGHSHGNLERVIPHRFDVGVDALPPFHDKRPYAPIPMDAYFAAAEQQTFIPQDHHGG